MLLERMAKNSGVLPFPSATFTSAPNSTNSSRTSVFPGRGRNEIENEKYLALLVLVHNQ